MGEQGEDEDGGGAIPTETSRASPTAETAKAETAKTKPKPLECILPPQPATFMRSPAAGGAARGSGAP